MIVAFTYCENHLYNDHDEDDITITHKNFHQAVLQGAAGANVHKCPPVVCIPFNGSHEEILRLIVDTKVISVTPEYARNHKFQLSFQWEKKKLCLKCGIMFLCEKRESGEEHHIAAFDDRGYRVDTSHSCCHPMFVSRNKGLMKVVGGVKNVLGFGNSNEICIKCNGPPGSQGCHPVNQRFSDELETVTHHFESTECQPTS